MSSHKDTLFLPDFCSVRMVLVVFFLTELLAFLLTLAVDYTEFGFMSEFGIRSLLTLWVGLMSAAALCSIRNKLNDVNHFIVGLIAFLVIQSITLLICWLVVDALPDQGLLLRLIAEHEKPGYYFRAVGISSLVSIAFLRYLFMQFQWRQQVEAKALAKLEALQARMRPHFLFNSLNTIASLTRIEPKLAEKLIEDLAELIRASMLIDHAKLVRLDEEVNLSKLYVEIELQRFDDRLKVSWDIANAPQEALIPPLSLQPVIENAVYHGIELNPQGGEIIVRGCLQQSKMVLSVRNSLPPTGTRSQRRTNKMAMENLKSRIKGCFAGEGNLIMHLAEDFYQVNIEFPYRSA